MNKIPFWVITMTAVLGSCSNEEITERQKLPNTDGHTPIEVSTYLPRMTRSYVAETATINNLTEAGGGFSLTALTANEPTTTVINGATFYANAETGVCTEAYGNLFYWPESGNVNFFAHHPVNSEICTLDAANGALDIQSDGLTDIIAANAANLATSTTVELNFKHLLAQVVMKISCNAANQPDGTQFILTSLTLTAPISATYNFGTEEIMADATKDEYPFIGQNDDPIELSESLNNVGNAMVAASSPTETDGAISATTECTLSVGYKTIIGTNEKTYTKNATVKLAAGYVNILNITVSGDQPISISANVSGWESAETQNISWNDDDNNADAHEYVDLGLPSGLLWATCNIGAGSPEQFGDYFAWGETKAYNEEDLDNAMNYNYNMSYSYIKTYYDWSTYKYCNGSYTTLTKYNHSSDYGFVDNKKELETNDDAASTNWGKTWRTPTIDEWSELWSNCTDTWTTENGIYGRKLTSNNNGAELFLPAAGYRLESSNTHKDSYGYFWSSTLLESFPGSACGVYFNSSILHTSDGDGDRRSARSVRAVRKP